MSAEAFTFAASSVQCWIGAPAIATTLSPANIPPAAARSPAITESITGARKNPMFETSSTRSLSDWTGIETVPRCV
ncbi:hypothetical protein D3C83_72830 [compost metagenome]